MSFAIKPIGMYDRSTLLFGTEAVERLRKAHVLVVGLGGVGGYAAEAICRAGVGAMTVVDGDFVNESNINRQIIALHSTVGQSKAELFCQRLSDINPECRLTVCNEYLRDERMVELLKADKYDYVVDAIDTLAPKVFLLYHCRTMGIPIVSSMGSGGKVDPSQVHITDISKSHTCPLAAMVRKRLHHLGIRDGIQVVFSTEKIPPHAMIEESGTNHRTTIGTSSYMPPIFGLYVASVVIRELANPLGETSV